MRHVRLEIVIEYDGPPWSVVGVVEPFLTGMGATELTIDTKTTTTSDNHWDNLSL